VYLKLLPLNSLLYYLNRVNFMFIGQSHRFQHIWSLFNVYLLNMIGSFLLSRPLIVTVSLRLRLELAS